jgi:2,3-bisphosphoglycerate-independent phosphoglycerate mutase
MENKNKKFAVILIDGAADYPIDELGGKTPLQVAVKPNIDMLAASGETGMVKTIPDVMSPGSDTANLSILGYDPAIYSTGRSSLEAISIGIRLSDDDITFRCNLVTLSNEKIYGQKTMVDYSAGEITTDEAKVLITELGEKLGTDKIRFYPGVSYRHVIVWEGGPDSGAETYALTPPHDISGKVIGQYLPGGKYGPVLLELMEKSSGFLQEHPVNIKRASEGKKPANSAWIWAKAKRPKLDSFKEKYGLKGSVISAVDLVKGIGISAGLTPVSVEGATGNINTNFEGKARAALKELESGQDFVFIHVEAPDECSHQGNLKEKIRAIELIDSLVVKNVKEGLDRMSFYYSIMVLPDHPTPLSKKTHTSDAVPFLIYTKNGDPKQAGNNTVGFDEADAAKSGLYIDKGYLLMDYFIGKKK